MATDLAITAIVIGPMDIMATGATGTTADPIGDIGPVGRFAVESGQVDGADRIKTGFAVPLMRNHLALTCEVNHALGSVTEKHTR
jgi:hypothetical protein